MQPFLQQAQAAGTAAGTALGGIGTGATAFQQDVQDFMSPYQAQVIQTAFMMNLIVMPCANTRTNFAIKRSTSSFGCARQWSSGSATRRVWHRGCERTSFITGRSLATRFYIRQQLPDNKILLIEEGYITTIKFRTVSNRFRSNSWRHNRNKYCTFRFVGRTTKLKHKQKLMHKRSSKTSRCSSYHKKT